MGKKVDKEFEGIKDYYVLQCKCTELKNHNKDLLELLIKLMIKDMNTTLKYLILKDKIKENKK